MKTSSFDHVECPYCGGKHENPWDWIEDGSNATRRDCQDCGKTFVYWSETDTTYFARDIEGGQMVRDMLRKASQQEVK